MNRAQWKLWDRAWRELNPPSLFTVHNCKERAAFRLHGIRQGAARQRGAYYRALEFAIRQRRESARWPLQREFVKGYCWQALREEFARDGAMAGRLP